MCWYQSAPCSRRKGSAPCTTCDDDDGDERGNGHRRRLPTPRSLHVASPFCPRCPDRKIGSCPCDLRFGPAAELLTRLWSPPPGVRPIHAVRRPGSGSSPLISPSWLAGYRRLVIAVAGNNVRLSMYYIFYRMIYHLSCAGIREQQWGYQRPTTDGTQHENAPSRPPTSRSPPAGGTELSLGTAEPPKGRMENLIQGRSASPPRRWQAGAAFGSVITLLNRLITCPAALGLGEPSAQRPQTPEPTAASPHRLGTHLSLVYGKLFVPALAAPGTGPCICQVMVTLASEERSIRT